MLSKQRFHEILKEILSKSKENRVNWRHEGQGFFIEFPGHARIVVQYYSPDSEPDSFTAEFIAKNVTLCSITAEDGERDYEFLKSLFYDAYRHVTGWDKALDEIERQLKGDGWIGELEDDIPF